MFAVKTDDLNLSPGKWHILKLSWNIDRSVCDVLIDAKKTMSLKMKNPTDTGISYIRFRSSAEKGDTDNAGMLVDYVKSNSEDPFSTSAYK